MTASSVDFKSKEAKNGIGSVLLSIIIHK